MLRATSAQIINTIRQVPVIRNPKTSAKEGIKSDFAETKSCLKPIIGALLLPQASPAFLTLTRVSGGVGAIIPVSVGPTYGHFQENMEVAQSKVA